MSTSLDTPTLFKYTVFSYSIFWQLQYLFMYGTECFNCEFPIQFSLFPLIFIMTRAILIYLAMDIKFIFRGENLIYTVTT